MNRAPSVISAFGMSRTVKLFCFQAEDSIRGRNVTGVQTCALPIYGDQGWYDSGGNIVLLANSLASGGDTLSSNTRPFGSPSALTATGTAAFDLDVSGVAQGVTIDRKSVV